MGSVVASPGLYGAQAQKLGCTGLVVPQHVGSSWTRDRAHVSCIGRWILYHWAAREALLPIFNCLFLGNFTHLSYLPGCWRQLNLWLLVLTREWEKQEWRWHSPCSQELSLIGEWVVSLLKSQGKVFWCHSGQESSRIPWGRLPSEVAIWLWHWKI